MEREDRYLIFKQADIAQCLSDDEIRSLNNICDQIQRFRETDGKRTDKKYVVVADDWPMYETVWEMIEAWVDGGASPSIDR